MTIPTQMNRCFEKTLKTTTVCKCHVAPVQNGEQAGMRVKGPGGNNGFWEPAPSAFPLF